MIAGKNSDLNRNTRGQIYPYDPDSAKVLTLRVIHVGFFSCICLLSGGYQSVYVPLFRQLY